MPCYRPLTGWFAKQINPTGKRSIIFRRSEAMNGNKDIPNPEIQVPCGQCSGCRLEHSRNWAVRCMHEAQMHENNCFITLTYCDEKLPWLGEGKPYEKKFPTLVKKDFQLFMMRLRKKYGDGIKFYACGEYGDIGCRPHYHACIFGLDFKDKELWKSGEYPLYVSEELNKLWTDPKDGKPLGFSTIGEVNFETAAYTARYCMKKRKGKNWETYYEFLNENTGEIHMLQPEFALMSRRPGIGKKWLEKYGKEVLDNDSVIVNYKEMKPPAYYDYLFDKEVPEKIASIKKERRLAAAKQKEKFYLQKRSPSAVLLAKETIKKQQITQLKRSLE